MKRLATAMSVAAVVVLSASLMAQAKPNFSGKWVPDTEKNAAAMAAMGGGRMAGGGGGGGRMGGGRGGGGTGPMTITMDATTLTMERENPNGTTKAVYKLDGSESKNMMSMRGQEMEQVSKAKIDGMKVVIATQGMNGETVQTWYMDGDWLVMERTIGENTLKTYYKKQ
jgi:Tol biopolymer transport system component